MAIIQLLCPGRPNNLSVRTGNYCVYRKLSFAESNYKTVLKDLKLTTVVAESLLTEKRLFVAPATA